MGERVASLTAEVSRLETRLGHAASRADLATERERQAEERLDKALSLHARQMGTRQRREGELERMVAELGAALVVAKNKVEAANDDTAGESVRRAKSTEAEREDGQLDFKACLQDSQDEIETLRAQLALEQQRCVALHDELQDLSRETLGELTEAHTKQRQYEREISDLTSLWAVQTQSSPARRASGREDDGVAGLAANDNEDAYDTHSRQSPGDGKNETEHLRKQITSLSEKIFEMQTIIDNGRAEISTLRNRWTSAKRSADIAEQELEAANQRLMLVEGSTALSGISSADEATGFQGRSGVKQRYLARKSSGASTVRRTRRRGHPDRSSQVESIRSALGLQPDRFLVGTWREVAASLLDAFDAIAIDLGSHFRQSPISRLAFILYLFVLHAWGFFLLVYHTHAQGTGHLRGSGGVMIAPPNSVHGPEALTSIYRHVEQAPEIFAAAAKAAISNTSNSPP